MLELATLRYSKWIFGQSLEIPPKVASQRDRRRYQCRRRQKLLNIILYFRGASARTYLYALVWLAARLIMVSKQF